MYSKKDQTYFGVSVKPGAAAGNNSVAVPIGSNFISGLFPKVTMWICISWEGHAQRIVKKSEMSATVISDWFQCSDKGGMGAFGVDSKGRVIVGCALVDAKDGKPAYLEAYPVTVANPDIIYASTYEIMAHLETLAKRYPELSNKLMADASGIVKHKEEQEARRASRRQIYQNQ